MYIVGIALAYFILVRLSSFFIVPAERIPSIAPASGLVLAAFLLARHGTRRFIFVGIGIASISALRLSNYDLVVSGGFALANIVEAAFATWVLERFLNAPILFDRLTHVIGLFAVAIFANALTAIVGATIPALAYGVDFTRAWVTVWIAHGLGILLITPLIVMWALRPPSAKRLGSAKLVEAGLLLIGLTLFSGSMFLFDASSLGVFALHEYMVLPFVIWAALRFSPRVVTLVLVYLSMLAIAGATVGRGYFAQGFSESAHQVLIVQIFLAIVALSSLLLSVVLAERQRAVSTWRESEERYRTLVEFFPDGVLMHRDSNIIFANTAAATILGADTPSGLVGKRLLDFVHPDLRPAVEQRVQKIITQHQGVPLIEERLVRLDGRIIDADVVARPIVIEGKTTSLTIFRDITERKQAERALVEKERHLARAQEIAHIGRWTLDFKTQTVQGSDEFFRIFGLETGDSSFESCVNLIDPDDREIFTHTIAQSIANHTSYDLQVGLLYHDGARKHIRAIGEPELDNHGRRTMIGIVQDITERRRHERELEAIVSVSEALRMANTRAQIFSITVAQVSTLLNTTGTAIGQYDPLTHESVIVFGDGSWANSIGVRTPAGMGMSGYVAQNRIPYVTQDLQHDPVFYSHELIGNMRGAACVPLITQNLVVGWLFAGVLKAMGDEDVRILKAIANIAANAIERTSLNEQTERNLQRMVALRTIDQAVSSSFDLRVTLDILLSYVQTELQIDAAVILLLQPTMRTLDFTAGRGLRTNVFRNVQVRLGESYAGRAALERQTLIVKNWRAEITHPDKIKNFTSILQAEGFVGFITVPLFAKGLVQGVLEVYQRSPLDPDNDWIDFLHSLAGQAAIAIDNANLFDRLQHSNSELVQSYDATIEGWSRALDLRDKETEGHTERVTEMTLELARAMGLRDTELVHVRRGALLHDIGKMGVPDAILRKPNPLDPEEWKQMRFHPQYAYELLSPIPYLRPALAIPYYHHEKWDGTGYPHGMKGTEIPLVARIFAVVDVWDALTSDRPYRQAWSVAQAREFIREQSGKHFDPQVVNAFLDLLDYRAQ
ncbi:MAG: PAS domain S-box protein [Chloroflexi bacterium]|nr:PAS domain S-box protein [Chloroflexota bacterium]